MKAAPIRFGSGDLLDIRVFGVPELTTEVRINDFGQISFPLVGDVAIAGMTSDEAKAEIERKLRAGGFVNNPQVSIFPKEFATQGISVLGEVNKPGVFTMQGPRRMFDVLSAAGGTTPRAGRTVSITHRDDPDHPVEVELSRDPAKNLALKNNVQIYPGDTVVVSRAGVVYVVGEVAHPAGLVMENNERMSALQAYAMAGGATSTAKLSDSRVIRRTPTGLQEIRIPMKQMLEAKADDIPLQAEDILYIPGSPGKKAARRTMDSIISITTGLALRY